MVIWRLIGIMVETLAKVGSVGFLKIHLPLLVLRCGLEIRTVTMRTILRLCTSKSSEKMIPLNTFESLISMGTTDIFPKVHSTMQRTTSTSNRNLTTSLHLLTLCKEWWHWKSTYSRVILAMLIRDSWKSSYWVSKRMITGWATIHTKIIEVVPEVRSQS